MWRVEFIIRKTGEAIWRCYKDMSEAQVRKIADRNNWQIKFMVKEY